MKTTQTNPLEWIDDELARLADGGLRRSLAEHSGPQQVQLQVAGRDLVNFGSNDYLGLAADIRLWQAAARAAETDGWGAGASPLVTGRTAAHRQLEERLAQFECAEAALVFSSGYAANVGTIAALAARGDAIYSDDKNHASMIDGARLSRADVHVFPHRDTKALEAMLHGGGAYRRRLIVTESVFSMDGDLALLVELADLAERFDGMLLVDEAHATGVFGRHGRGLAEELDVEDRVAVRIGTLSKALGSAGGFVCGSAALIEWLVNRARSYVFSTALPSAVCGASMAAIEIVSQEPGRRIELRKRAADLREALRVQGWNLANSESQIIPLVVGEVNGAMHLAASLLEQEILAPAIRPPSVPAGGSLVRISLSHAHTSEMVERLVAALLRCGPSAPRLK
jgi:8-amino-7-oxononanoate synthase